MNYNSLIKVVKHFSNEEVCRKHLENAKWGNGPVTCPKCGNEKTYWLKKQKSFICANRKCWTKFSHTVGTIFESSNIPLSTWFIAIYLITSHKSGISSHQLGRDLDITQKTAWFMLHRIREMMQTQYGYNLRGRIETDETYIGGKEKFKHKNKKTKNSQGRSLKTKTAVFGVKQRGGLIVARTVDNTKRATLEPIIKSLVSKESIVYSDEWWAYRKLGEYYSSHHVIKHREGEYARGHIHTNSIENFWSNLKRGITGIYRHISDKHMDRYLNEFMFRPNYTYTKNVGRKWYRELPVSQEIRFDLAILLSIDKRLTYKQLIGKEPIKKSEGTS